MDKKSFISIVNYEDKNLLSNLYDKISLAERTQKTVYSNEFLTPNIWKAVTELEHSFEVRVFNCGIFEDSERRMMAFSQDELIQYPMEVVKINNESKFHDLAHKDFLGAIMSLGIKREKYGDMILKDNSVYIAVCSDISSYLVQNLERVGNCPCRAEIVEDIYQLDLKPETEERLINVASLRMDSVVGAISNLSRSKAVDIISAGKVFLNYEELREKDKVVQLNDTLTIRGCGKFKVSEILGTTQKGRLRILIKKYI